MRLSGGYGAEYGPKLGSAYRTCEQLARAHYENFPVASRLVPEAMRPHIAAVYAFARTADDFADEGDLTPNERLARLGAWRDMLLRRRPPPLALPHQAADIFTALHHTIERFEIDVALFEDLLSAFEQDVTTHRYDTWHDVLDYCRRSANPVGRLVLSIAGCRDAESLRRSDAVCTALQLTNFWQDFGGDWIAGRLYVPRELLERHGAREAAVAGGSPGRPDHHWQAVFADVVSRTRVLFDEGRDVSEAVHGRLRFELRATWLGGTTILTRTAELRTQSFMARPTLTRSDVLRLALGALWWPRGSRR